MLDCVIDVVPVLVGPAHDLRTLIPNLLTVAAPIEEVFFGFFLLLAKYTKRGSDEASFSEIVPSQGSVMYY